MPWTTINTEVTAQDVNAWEEMLDRLAEDDRRERLNASHRPAMTLEPLDPANYYRHPDYMEEGWELLDCSANVNREECHD